MRLITFGCSLTEGHALNKKTDAWPYIISDNLGVQVLNNGVNGNSNTKILYDVLTYDFQPDDIVIVMWTYATREMRLLSDSSEDKFGPWCSGQEGLAWLRFADPHDYNIKSLMHIHHCKLQLTSLSVKHLFIKTDENMVSSRATCKFDNDLFDIDISGEDILDFATDNSHPGPKSHYRLGIRLSDLIRGKFL